MLFAYPHRIKRKIAKIIGVSTLEFDSYISFFFKRKKKGTKIIIFGQGRSGSSLLENLIESTGHFKAQGELLRFSNIKRPITFITGLSKNKKNFIFHLKLYHLYYRDDAVSCAKFLNHFYSKGWKIIFLERFNKVDLQISYLLALHRGKFHKNDDLKEFHKMQIDVDKFLPLVQDRFLYRKLEQEALSNLKFCHVIYERDLQESKNHQQTIDRIMDYMNLERRTVSTKFKKINNFKRRDLISNYNQFEKMIKENGIDDKPYIG